MTIEAQVSKGALWKRIIDSMKDLVNEANFECTPSGISIQSMDSAHVALVSLGLQKDGFGIYNCHRQQVLGVNLGSLSKVLKVTDNDDIITLRHTEDSDILTVLAESGDKKRSEYQLKLMEIEADSMGIPDIEYNARLSLPSEQFAKIVRDMAIFGETVTIDVTREAVKFSGSGDIGEGFTTLNSDGEVGKVKSEVKQELKSEPVDEESGVQRFAEEKKSDNKKKAEKHDSVYISTAEPIQLSFALRYLTVFAKGNALSDRVEICLTKDSPCRIEYKIENVGYLRWYLAPKVDGDE